MRELRFLAEKMQKSPLSRERILDTAYQLIEEKGSDSFSMRTLGTKLQVSAMAVYSYFSSRDEILSELCIRYVDSLDTKPVVGERWDDTLYRTLGSIRKTAYEHPHILAVFANDRVTSGGFALHTERVINLHLEQGIPQDILKVLWVMIDTYATGFLTGELSNEDGAHYSAIITNRDEELQPWKQVAKGAYSASSFVTGIEIIIKGIRSLAAPDPCEWYTPAELE